PEVGRGRLALARLRAPDRVLPRVGRPARCCRQASLRAVVCLQRAEPPPHMAVVDAIRRRKLLLLLVALNGPRCPPFAQRDLRHEKLALEKLRGTAMNGRFERIDSSNEFAKNIRHRAALLSERDNRRQKLMQTKPFVGN